MFNLGLLYDDKAWLAGYNGGYKWTKASGGDDEIEAKDTADFRDASKMMQRFRPFPFSKPSLYLETPESLEVSPSYDFHNNRSSYLLM